MEPNGVPGGLHERLLKVLVLVDVLDQSVPVNVALGVSAHRGVQVEERHLVLRVGNGLTVNDERVNLGLPRPRPRPTTISTTAVPDNRPRLGVGHAPRLDVGRELRFAGLAGHVVQGALLDIDVVVALLGVGAGWRRR